MSPCLKEQIDYAADIGNVRKCSIKIKLLRDSFENRFCNFAKEEDCISPFSLSEQKIRKIPTNI